MLPDSAEVDALEGRIIRCLQIAPRVPLRAVAHVLDVSEQTVARRYRKLHAAGVVRVTLVVNPGAVGQGLWMVRTRCKPSGALAVAQALARRDDIGWVSLVSGGAEVLCVLRAQTREARDDLLTHRLPRSAPVLDISAALYLHRFVGGGLSDGTGGVTATDDWAELADLLTPDQERAIAEHAPNRPSVPKGMATLHRDDRAMTDTLARDGRTPIATLAAQLGLSERATARRLTAMLESGVAYLDVDVSLAALGLHAQAGLWLSVVPSAIDAAGQALAAEREVAFAAALTGPHNLTAMVCCRDVEHLYRFATDRVGNIPGVQAMEIQPVLRVIKQAGALTDGERLAV